MKELNLYSYMYKKLSSIIYSWIWFLNFNNHTQNFENGKSKILNLDTTNTNLKIQIHILKNSNKIWKFQKIKNWKFKNFWKTQKFWKIQNPKFWKIKKLKNISTNNNHFYCVGRSRWYCNTGSTRGGAGASP